MEKISVYVLDNQRNGERWFSRMLSQSTICHFGKLAETRRAAESLIQSLPRDGNVIFLLQGNLTEEDTSGSDGEELSQLIRDSGFANAFIISVSDQPFKGPDMHLGFFFEVSALDRAVRRRFYS